MNSTITKTLPYPFQYVWFAIFFITFLSATYFAANNTTIILSLEIWNIRGISWDLPILFDTIRLLFARTVALISSAIFTFGITYIHHEPNQSRFWILVIRFVGAIYVVIFVPNIPIIIIGWDGLGITSYLLIIHYQNLTRLYGGYITIISNRIGDAILILTISITSTQYHRILWHLKRKSSSNSILENILNIDYVVITLLIIAAYTKRAQAPFRAWLPEAIAAPTPVRALVHSSTLVAAGIYLLIRTYDFWSDWPLAHLSIAGTGLISIIAGGGKATIEADVKKTVAYSTISQLGYIVTILGLGHPNIAFFHLITHALFKATIFIRVGVIFSYRHHYQTYDQWRAKWFIPIAATGLGLSLASINIFPFLGGIYSKELIVATSWSHIFLRNNNILFYFSSFTLLASSSLTIVYRIRIWRGLIKTKYTARPYYIIEKPIYRPDIYAIDNNTNLKTPILIISLGTITAGRVVIWVMIIPNDYSPIPWIIKLIAISSLFAGTFRAVKPCREVTKIRVNQRVCTYRAKKKSIKIKTKLIKPLIVNKNQRKFIIAAVYGDWGHKHDGLHWFIERTFIPIYRVIYASSKIIYVIEQGLLNTWILITPHKIIKKRTPLTQRIIKWTDAYLGVTIILIICILLLLFIPSLIKAMHLYCEDDIIRYSQSSGDLNSPSKMITIWLAMVLITSFINIGTPTL